MTAILLAGAAALALLAPAQAQTLRIAMAAEPTSADPHHHAAAPNPLRDARVGQALSPAIDRRAITERIMDGISTPATRFLPDGMFGTIPGPPVPPHDPARARLLREASARALERTPILPIHFENAVWGFRRGIAFAGRMDQTTLAQEITPE